MWVAISAVNRIIEGQPNIVREDHVYKDTVRKIALLRYSAAFRPKCGYTRETQGWGMTNHKYFMAISSVSQMVGQFFNSDPDHMEYALLVDCTTLVHSCSLFIRRRNVVHKNQPSYIFNAFDPNTTCISECFSAVAKKIGSVKEIKVWSSKQGNSDGVCFGLNWRFIFSIMCEGHDPFANEKVVGLYKCKSNRAKPYPHQNSSLISSIGYVKRGGRGRKARTTFHFKPSMTAAGIAG